MTQAIDALKDDAIFITPLEAPHYGARRRADAYDAGYCSAIYLKMPMTSCPCHSHLAGLRIAISQCRAR